jgi:hypothetical protein
MQLAINVQIPKALGGVGGHTIYIGKHCFHTPLLLIYLIYISLPNIAKKFDFSILFAVQCRYRGELHAGTSDSDDRSLHRGSCACITCKLQSPAEC